MSISTGSRKAKAFEITARVAYREFEQTFRRPPRDHEACALIARFLPGRHWCGASSCPPECPKYARVAPAESEAMSEGSATIVSGTTTGTPEIMRDLDDDEPDDLDQHVPEPRPARSPAPPEPPPEPVAAAAASPPAAARATPTTQRARQKAPPCLRCGQYRPIMTVMAGGPGGPAFTLCSRCYRFADVADAGVAGST